MELLQLHVEQQFRLMFKTRKVQPTDFFLQELVIEMLACSLWDQDLQNHTADWCLLTKICFITRAISR